MSEFCNYIRSTLQRISLGMLLLVSQPNCDSVWGFLVSCNAHCNIRMVHGRHMMAWWMSSPGMQDGLWIPTWTRQNSRWWGQLEAMVPHLCPRLRIWKNKKQWKDSSLLSSSSLCLNVKIFFSRERSHGKSEEKLWRGWRGRFAD